MPDKVKSWLRSLTVGESKDKRMIAAVAILVVFVLVSLVMSLRSGAFHEIWHGFRFQVSDGIALALLGVLYLVYKKMKGGHNG